MDDRIYVQITLYIGFLYATGSGNGIMDAHTLGSKPSARGFATPTYRLTTHPVVYPARVA